METQTFAEKISKAPDFLPINGTDYIEFYVATLNKRLTTTKRHLGFKAWLMPARKLVYAIVRRMYYNRVKSG